MQHISRTFLVLTGHVALLFVEVSDRVAERLVLARARLQTGYLDRADGLFSDCAHCVQIYRKEKTIKIKVRS